MVWAPDETYNNSVKAIRQMLIATVADPLDSARTDWIYIGWARAQDTGVPVMFLHPTPAGAKRLGKDASGKVIWRQNVLLYARVLAKSNLNRDKILSDLLKEVQDNADIMEAGATYPSGAVMVIEGLVNSSGLEVGYSEKEQAYTGGVQLRYSYVRTES